MNNYIVCFFVFMFILSNCSSGSKSAPTQYKPFSMIPGISTHLNMCKDASNAVDISACSYQLQQLKSAGVVYVRTDFLWSEIEPQQGRFTFNGYDTLVSAVLSNNMQLNAILDYGNAWADAKGSDSYPPDNPQTFADFAYQVALHYKGRIQRYEIWNEENTFQFWPPKADPQAYGALLKATYKSIKSADPNALVAFGGVYMWNWNGIITGGDTFIDQVLSLYPSLGNSMDAVAFHPYMNYPPSVAPDFSSPTQRSFDQMCNDVKAVLKKHNISKPLWITEIGWPTYPPVDESMQARWLVRMYLEAVEQNIDSVYWYDFIDDTGCFSPVQECYFGLFNYITSPSYSTPPQPKQAFYALKTMVDILSGTSFNRDVSTEFKLNGATAMYFTSKDSSKEVWVFFAQHGTPPQNISVPIKGLTFYDLLGKTFTPLSTGSAYSLTVTTSPVYAVK